jgi:hypothetical protein
MHEISFQAVQFLPRIFSVIILLFLTLLVAKFAKSVVQRAAHHDKKGSLARKILLKLSDIASWIVILIFLPFIIGAAGLDAVWLRQVQLFLGQFFSNWPIWMLLSVMIAGLSYLLLNIPRFIIQLKGSLGTSPKKF